MADCQARKVALYETLSVQTPLNWTGLVEQETHTHTHTQTHTHTEYTQHKLERYEKKGAKITEKVWLV